MTLLDRYVARHLLSGWLMVFALLGILFGLFTFIDELERTTVNYQIRDALQYVVLTTPQRTLDLFPIIALLGTLLAYISLVRSNELVAILTTGLSNREQMLSAALPAALLMLLLWTAGEFVAAPLAQQAETSRQQARGGSAYRLEKSGLWSSDGMNFHHISCVDNALKPQKIATYTFSPQGDLQTALHAQHADIVQDKRWLLHNVQSKQVLVNTDTAAVSTGPQVQTTQHSTLEQEGFWSLDQLRSQTLSAPSMSLRNLHTHIEHLRVTGQNLKRLPHLFWQRLVLPITSAAMVLLALQISLSMFIRRDLNFGAQVGIGVAISIFFYISSQIIYTAGLLLNTNAMLTAAMPLLLILTATLLLYRRQF